jgi:hypothetical protein
LNLEEAVPVVPHFAAAASEGHMISWAMTATTFAGWWLNPPGLEKRRETSKSVRALIDGHGSADFEVRMHKDKVLHLYACGGGSCAGNIEGQALAGGWMMAQATAFSAAMRLDHVATSNINGFANLTGHDIANAGLWLSQQVTAICDQG